MGGCPDSRADTGETVRADRWLDRHGGGRYTHVAYNWISYKRDPDRFGSRWSPPAGARECSCQVRGFEQALRALFVHTSRQPCCGAFFDDGARFGPRLTEVKRISTTEPRLNDRIRAQRCRLISDDGEQLGIFMVSDAMRMADEQGLDLVEIAPNAEPPVCKIMDYGKYKYEMEQKAKKARKNQTRVEIKEIKFRPKIDIHDYETKKKHVVRFLESGAKVKVTIMFRGREMVHAERGLVILQRLEEDIAELAFVESKPKLEGRNMFMLVAPHKKEVTKPKAADAAPATAPVSEDAEPAPAAVDDVASEPAATE